MDTIGVEVEVLVRSAQPHLSNELHAVAVAPYEAAIRESLDRVGIDSRHNHPEGDAWGVGPDGLDTRDGLPILEVRSAVIAWEERDRMRSGLGAVREAVLSRPELAPAANVAIHIHVSTPWIRDGDVAAMLRLTEGLDEEAIRRLPYDRDFRFAKSNAEQRAFLSGRVPGNLVELRELYGQDRDWGVNLNTRHPAVEYRYLPTAILLDFDGVAKTMRFVETFYRHAVTSR